MDHNHEHEQAPFLSSTDTFTDAPAVELGHRKRGRSRSSSSSSTFNEPKYSHHHDTTPSTWVSTLTNLIRGRGVEDRKSRHQRPDMSTLPMSRSRGRLICGGVLRTIFVILALLGIFQTILFFGGLYFAIHSDDYSDPPPAWHGPEHVVEGGQHWPTDFSADIRPVNCASHNDYWRKEPLFTALKAGCVGVEADIWYRAGDLFVGHSKQSLTPVRTFQSLYLNPILHILDRQNPITEFHPELDDPPNGVFDTDPSQTLILLVDFKEDDPLLWETFYAQLAPLREKNYLTYFNGSAMVERAVTVVGTGGAPFEKILQLSPRDVFFDAPLASLSGQVNKFEANRLPINSTTNEIVDLSSFTAENSFYASTSFLETVGFPRIWKLTDAQMALIRSHLADAHARGLKARYWDIPEWPRSMRNYIWAILVQEGIDYLNVDDVKGAARGEWGPPKKKGWWRPWETWT